MIIRRILPLIAGIFLASGAGAACGGETGAETNKFAIEPYFTYAPARGAPDRAQFGGGILVVYDMTKFAGVVVGADYLGQFSLVSGNISLKYPISIGPSVTLVPFVMGGLGYAVSGAGGRISSISDIGVYARSGKIMSGKFNVGVCAGRWNNAGDYSGVRYHFFVGWSKGF